MSIQPILSCHWVSKNWWVYRYLIYILDTGEEGERIKTVYLDDADDDDGNASNKEHDHEQISKHSNDVIPIVFYTRFNKITYICPFPL